MSIPSKSFFAPSEVADLLAIPRHLVYRMVREGRMKAVRYGLRIIRIPREEIERVAKGGAYERAPTADSG